MTQLVFSDLTDVLVPILMKILGPTQDSKWQWKYDWLQQVNAYRHYPAYNILVIKLKKCNSPDFYIKNIEAQRCRYIKEAFDKHFGLYPPGVLIKVFAHNVSAETWIKKNREAHV